MSVLEIWGAEYQENDCLLIKPEDSGVLEGVCARERCSMQVHLPFLKASRAMNAQSLPVITATNVAITETSR